MGARKVSEGTAVARVARRFAGAVVFSLFAVAVISLSLAAGVGLGSPEVIDVLDYGGSDGDSSVITLGNRELEAALADGSIPGGSATSVSSNPNNKNEFAVSVFPCKGNRPYVYLKCPDSKNVSISAGTTKWDGNDWLVETDQGAVVRKAEKIVASHFDFTLSGDLASYANNGDLKIKRITVSGANRKWGGKNYDAFYGVSWKEGWHTGNSTGNSGYVCSSEIKEGGGDTANLSLNLDRKVTKNNFCVCCRIRQEEYTGLVGGRVVKGKFWNLQIVFQVTKTSKPSVALNPAPTSWVKLRNNQKVKVSDYALGTATKSLLGSGTATGGPADWTFSGLNNGFTITATDKVGNKTTKTFSKTDLKIDTDNPTVTINGYCDENGSLRSSQTVTKDDVYVKVTAGDVGGSGVVSGSGGLSTCTLGTAEQTFKSIGTGAFVVGPIKKNGTLKVKSKDNAGNTSGEATSNINVIDKINPTLVFTGVNWDNWHNSPPTLKITYRDETGGDSASIASGFRKLRYVTAEGSLDKTVDAYSAPFEIVLPFKGTYTFTATDKAGNVSAEYTFKLKLDTCAPHISEIAYANGYFNDKWTSEDVRLNVKTSDAPNDTPALSDHNAKNYNNGSGIKKIELWYRDETDAARPWKKQEETNNADFTFILSENYDIKHDYKVIVFDNAGNSTCVFDGENIALGPDGNPKDFETRSYHYDGADYASYYWNPNSSENSAIRTVKIDKTEPVLEFLVPSPVPAAFSLLNAVKAEYKWQKGGGQNFELSYKTGPSGGTIKAQKGAESAGADRTIPPGQPEKDTCSYTFFAVGECIYDFTLTNGAGTISPADVSGVTRIDSTAPAVELIGFGTGFDSDVFKVKEDVVNSIKGYISETDMKGAWRDSSNTAFLGVFLLNDGESGFDFYKEGDKFYLRGVKVGFRYGDYAAEIGYTGSGGIRVYPYAGAGWKYVVAVELWNGGPGSLMRAAKNSADEFFYNANTGKFNINPGTGDKSNDDTLLQYDLTVADAVGNETRSDIIYPVDPIEAGGGTEKVETAELNAGTYSVVGSYIEKGEDGWPADSPWTKRAIKITLKKTLGLRPAAVKYGFGESAVDIEPPSSWLPANDVPSSDDDVIIILPESSRNEKIWFKITPSDTETPAVTWGGINVKQDVDNPKLIRFYFSTNETLTSPYKNNVSGDGYADDVIACYKYESDSSCVCVHRVDPDGNGDAWTTKKTYLYIEAEDKSGDGEGAGLKEIVVTFKKIVDGGLENVTGTYAEGHKIIGAGSGSSVLYRSGAAEFGYTAVEHDYGITFKLTDNVLNSTSDIVYGKDSEGRKIFPYVDDAKPEIEMLTATITEEGNNNKSYLDSDRLLSGDKTNSAVTISFKYTCGISGAKIYLRKHPYDVHPLDPEEYEAEGGDVCILDKHKKSDGEIYSYVLSDSSINNSFTVILVKGTGEIACQWLGSVFRDMQPPEMLHIFFALTDDKEPRTLDNEGSPMRYVCGSDEDDFDEIDINSDPIVYTNRNIYAYFLVEDSASGIESVTYDGTALATAYIERDGCVKQYYRLLMTEPRKYGKIRCLDKAGNEEEYPKSDNKTMPIDKTEVVISVSASSAGSEYDSGTGFVNTDVIITLTVECGASGFDPGNVTYDAGNGSRPLSELNPTWNDGKAEIILSADLDAEYRFAAKNNITGVNAKNGVDVSGSSGSLRVRIDKTSPEILTAKEGATYSSLTGSWLNEAMFLTIGADGGPSGISTFTLYEIDDGGSWIKIASFEEDGTPLWTARASLGILPNTAFPEGYYYVKNDNGEYAPAAGDVPDGRTKYFVKNGTEYRSAGVLPAAAFPEGYYVKNDNGEYAPAAGNKPDGRTEYFIGAIARYYRRAVIKLFDGAGNSAQSGEFSLYVDTIKPRVGNYELKELDGENEIGVYTKDTWTRYDVAAALSDLSCGDSGAVLQYRIKPGGGSFGGEDWHKWDFGSLPEGNPTVGGSIVFTRRCDPENSLNFRYQVRLVSGAGSESEPVELGRIRIDKITPRFSDRTGGTRAEVTTGGVPWGEETTAGETWTISGWTSRDVIIRLSAERLPSGSSLWYRLTENGEFIKLTNGVASLDLTEERNSEGVASFSKLTHTLTNNKTNGVYAYKIISGSGVESDVYTVRGVRIDKNILNVSSEAYVSYEPMESSENCWEPADIDDYNIAASECERYNLGSGAWTRANSVVVRLKPSNIGPSGATLYAGGTRLEEFAAYGERAPEYLYYRLSGDTAFRLVSGSGNQFSLDAKIRIDHSIPALFVQNIGPSDNSQTTAIDDIKSADWDGSLENSWYTSAIRVYLTAGTFVKNDDESYGYSSYPPVSGYRVYYSTDGGNTWKEPSASNYVEIKPSAEEIVTKRGYKFRIVSKSGMEYIVGTGAKDNEGSVVVPVDRVAALAVADGRLLNHLSENDFEYIFNVDSRRYSLSIGRKMEIWTSDVSNPDAPPDKVLDGDFASFEKYINGGETEYAFGSFRHGDLLSLRYASNDTYRYRGAVITGGTVVSSPSGNLAEEEGEFEIRFVDEDVEVCSYFIKELDFEYRKGSTTSPYDRDGDCLAAYKQPPEQIAEIFARAVFEYNGSEYYPPLSVRVFDENGAQIGNIADARVGGYRVEVSVAGNNAVSFRLVHPNNVLLVKYFIDKRDETGGIFGGEVYHEINSENDFAYVDKTYPGYANGEFVSVPYYGESSRYLLTQSIYTSAVINNKFAGALDGGNNEISLFLPSGYAEGDFGLFKNLCGNISNLKIRLNRQITVRNAANVGILASEITGGKVKRIRVDGDLIIESESDSGARIGGLAGKISGNAEIGGASEGDEALAFVFMTNNGNRLSSAKVGGIAGSVEGSVAVRRVYSYPTFTFSNVGNDFKAGSLSAVVMNSDEETPVVFYESRYLKDNVFVNDEFADANELGSTEGVTGISFADITGSEHGEKIVAGQKIKEFVLSKVYENFDLGTPEYDENGKPTLGRGTPGEELPLSAPEQIAAMSRYTNLCYRLTSDVDLSGLREPVGVHKIFSGTFDGKPSYGGGYYKLSDFGTGLDASSCDKQGLFSQVSGRVSNLIFADAEINIATSGDMIFGLVTAKLRGGTVNGIIAIGNARISSFAPDGVPIGVLTVGGIVGETSQDSRLYDVFGLVNVKASARKVTVGSVAGRADGLTLGNSGGGVVDALGRAEAEAGTVSVGTIAGSGTDVTVTETGKVYRVKDNAYSNGNRTDYDVASGIEGVDFSDTSMRGRSFSDGTNAFSKVFGTSERLYKMEGLGVEGDEFKVETCEQFRYINQLLYAHYKIIGDIEFTADDKFETIGRGLIFSGGINGKGAESGSAEGGGVSGLSNVTDALVYKNAGKITDLDINIVYSRKLKRGEKDFVFGAVAIYNVEGGTLRNITVSGEITVGTETSRLQDNTATVSGFVGRAEGGVIETDSNIQTSISGLVITVDNILTVNVGGFVGTVTGAMTLTYGIGSGSLRINNCKNVNAGILVGRSSNFDESGITVTENYVYEIWINGEKSATPPIFGHKG